jgi:hypothetical protein
MKSSNVELIEISAKGVAYSICTGLGMTNEASAGEFADNSLDAEATGVSLFATPKYFVVVDNGKGMDDPKASVNLYTQKERTDHENGLFGAGLNAANAYISKPLEREIKDPLEYGLLILSRVEADKARDVNMTYLGYAMGAEGFYTSNKFNKTEDREAYEKIMTLCGFAPNHGTIMINARGANVSFLNQPNALTEVYEEIFHALETNSFDTNFIDEQQLWLRVMHYDRECVIKYNNVPLVADGVHFIDPYLNPEKSSYLNIAIRKNIEDRSKTNSSAGKKKAPPNKAVVGKKKSPKKKAKKAKDELLNDNEFNDDVLFQWESGDPVKHANGKQGKAAEWYYMPSTNSTRAKSAGNVIRKPEGPDDSYIIFRYQMIWASEEDTRLHNRFLKKRSFERNHLNLYQADLSGLLDKCHDYQRFCDRIIWIKSDGLDSVFKICINKSTPIGLVKKLNEALLWNAKNVMKHHWKVVKNTENAANAKRNNFKSSTKVIAAAKNQGRCAITGMLPYKVGNNRNPAGVPTHEDHDDGNPSNNAEDNCNRIRADLHHIKTYDEPLYDEILENMNVTVFEFPVKYYQMCEWAKLESPKYQSYLTKKSSHMTADGIPNLFKQECDIYWRIYGDVEPELPPPPYTVSGVRVSVSNPEKGKNNLENDEEEISPLSKKAKTDDVAKTNSAHAAAVKELLNKY